MKSFGEFITNVHHDDPDEISIIVMWESGQKNAAKKALDEWDEFMGREFPTHLLEGYDGWLRVKQRSIIRVMNECTKKNIEFLSVLKFPGLYYEQLTTLDKYMIRDLELHGWDLYVESINNKQK